MTLPDRSMADLLETPEPHRAVQRELLRRGPLDVAGLAASLDLDPAQALSRLEWLADRGYVEIVNPPGGEPMWQTRLRVAGRRRSGLDDLLDSL